MGRYDEQISESSAEHLKESEEPIIQKLHRIEKQMENFIKNQNRRMEMFEERLRFIEKTIGIPQKVERVMERDCV